MVQYLYLVETVDGKHTKIGVTDHPDRRARELQNGCPVPLVQRYMFDFKGYNAAIVERNLKQWFADQCVFGEWFCVTADAIVPFPPGVASTEPGLVYIDPSDKLEDSE
jgi:hypothetical protein